MKSSELSFKITLSKIIFVMLGIIACFLIPMISLSLADTEKPTLIQVGMTGLAVFALSVAFFAYCKNTLKVDYDWLSMIIIYTASIITAQFIFVPCSLYNQTITTGAFSLSPDPNSQFAWIFCGLSLMFIWMKIFKIIESFFVKSKHSQLVKLKDEKKKIIKTTFYIIIIIAVVFSGLLFVLPFMLVGLIFDAMNIPAFGIAISIAYSLAFFALYRFIKENSKVKLNTKKMALTSVLAIGLFMTVTLNLLWIIFMIMIVSIWQFDVNVASM